MEFKKVLDRIEEVNDTIPYIIERTDYLTALIDGLLSDNVINDREASGLTYHVSKIRDAMDSINGK